jgi:IS30 family transposase
LLDKGYSQRNIAECLKRSNSSISDEIRLGMVRNKYDPEKAHHKAYVRRWQSKYQGMRIVGDTKLKDFVNERLLKDDSPPNISGRIWKHEKHLQYVSKNSIYRYIESPYGRKIERYRDKKRQRRRHHRPKSERLKNRVFINKRPKYINVRKRIGDAEADFIVSGKSGKGILLVVTDRKSRMPYIERILNVTIPEVHRAFKRIKERFSELKTITTDNDILFRHHKKLEILLNIKIYFCNPYHSWEKGTVEKVNRLIRRDIPKGSNISKYSKKFIQSVENKLQNKIYKVLNYRTPLEVLNLHRKRKNTRE